MDDIKSFDVDEIKAAVAMAKIKSPNQPSYTREDYRAVVAAYCCEATCSDNLPSCAYSKSKKKILVWQKRVKVLKCLRYLNSCPYRHKKIKRAFPAFETKYLNTSVYKKRRGLARRLNQFERISKQQQDLRGISLVKILQNEN